MAKNVVSVDQVMDDIVHVQNQINGLTMLLNQKKATMAKYFDKSGERSASNDECTVYVQERTNIDYDIDALKQTLPRDQYDSFVVTEHSIDDWKGFCRLLKKHGLTSQEVRPFISITRKVDQQKLNQMYEHGAISIQDLQGCYTATVKKSIVLKLKNTEREIPIKEET